MCKDGIDLDFEKQILYRVGGNHCKAVEDMIIKTARNAVRQNAVEIVHRTLEMGLSYEQIAYVTGISIEQVKEIEGQKSA